MFMLIVRMCGVLKPSFLDASSCLRMDGGFDFRPQFKIGIYSILITETLLQIHFCISSTLLKGLNLPALLLCHERICCYLIG